MTAARELSRRTLLAAAAAATLGAATGCWATKPTEQANTDEEAAIFDLTFEIESSYRPFQLVAPGFVAATQSAERSFSDLVLSDASPPAPFVTVEAVVEPETDGVVVLGLASSAGAHLMAFYDRPGRQVGIEVRSNGETHLVASSTARLPNRFRLAFALCEQRVTVLAHTGRQWKPLLTERDAVAKNVDLRVPETLAGYRYAWGARAGSGTATLSGVRAGLFGMTGLRDQHLVQHADGTPYVVDGKAYLTATCAGLGFFQQAHWGVFTLDLADPRRLEQVAQLYFRRDGLLLGDHAGQVVRDDEHDRWIVATSSWGDFDYQGVHVRHVETSEDVLHGVHVLETTPTPLPTSVGAWDPGLTRIDGRWHVSFVESPSQDPFDFHPALAVGPQGAPWHDGLELVGAASGLDHCEGPILARVDGDWWFLASDGRSRSYPVFDLQMRRVGRLDAPYPTNIPHPQLLPLGDGDHLLVTFNGTQYAKRVMGYGGHGDVVIMRSVRS